MRLAAPLSSSRRAISPPRARIWISAISGDGFFTLQDPSSGIVYTRNGQFAEDKNGNVVSSTGQALQVYPPTGQRRLQHRRVERPEFADRAEPPLATTAGTVILNLPAGSTPPAVAPFDPTNSATLQPVYLDHGVRLAGQLVYPAPFYFTQTAAPGTWDVNMTVNGTS